MQASCCDHGFSPSSFSAQVAVSPVRGFTMTTFAAQPLSKKAAVIIARYRKHDLLIARPLGQSFAPPRDGSTSRRDRKSTRLNSSHLVISYAVFCLKKKNTTT